mmetsp:Transcript_792/g.1418  ORF Transcript_792/g.1418 Transcript_792/m.1418 type:complete len:113 (+) Transcript_792:57-395(+)
MRDIDDPPARSHQAPTYHAYLSSLCSDVAVVLYNRGTDADGNPTQGSKDISVTWQELWEDTTDADEYTVALRDLWEHEEVPPSEPATGHTAPVAPKDVVVLRAARSQGPGKV